MNRHSRLLLLLGAGMAVATLVAGWQLIRWRYATGDAHAPYSSLRADPLGTRVLFEALERMNEGRVERLFELPTDLPDPLHTTLLMLGLPPSATAGMADAQLVGIETFARAGGRVIVALLPEQAEPWNARRRERWAAKGGGPIESPQPVSSVRHRWGFSTGYRESIADDEGRFAPISARRETEAPAELPATVPWRSAVILEDLDKEWTVFLKVGEEPVMARRRIGAGELILTTDAYPFSNESLGEFREAELLDWYLGSRPHVVFLETHHGFKRKVGVAGLARRYRLTGFLLGGALWAGLCLWAGTTTLVPRTSARPGGQPFSGFDSMTGLARLMARTIPLRDLPKVCFEEWHQSVGAHDPRLAPLTSRLAGRVQDFTARVRSDRETLLLLAQMAREAQPYRRLFPRGSSTPFDHERSPTKP